MPYLSLIICLIGGLLYIVTRLDNGKPRPTATAVGELGKWAFIVGLAAFLFVGPLK